MTSLLLPASLNLIALDGGITVDHGGGLYPSATGTLSIVADQSITILRISRVLWGGFNLAFPSPGSLAFSTVGNVPGNVLGKLDDLVGTGILPTASDSCSDQCVTADADSDSRSLTGRGRSYGVGVDLFLKTAADGSDGVHRRRRHHRQFGKCGRRWSKSA